MNFLLYSINYSPELTGIGKYNGDLVPELVKRGSDVAVLTAPPYYPEWKRHEDFTNGWTQKYDVGVRIYRCPLYVPLHVTTLKRLLHLCSFGVSSGLRLFTLLRLKPDCIFLVQPTLFCAPIALLYAKLVGAKTILHIQDFEVDAMFGLGMVGSSKKTDRCVKESRIKKSIRACESWLMNRFDVVSSISYSMLDNVKNKGVADEKLLFFPNWSDTNFVAPDVDGSALRDAWGYKVSDKVILYSGNIGQKQGLEIVLEAAQAFSDESNVKFLIVGSGSYSGVLENQARSLGLQNLEFKPLQAWEDVPKILSMADVHLVVQRKGAADAVLPSKLTNILSAGGHALVTAEANTELGKISEKFPNIYTCVEPESTVSFVSGLKAILALDTTMPNMIARQYALDNLNVETVIDRFYASILELIDEV